MTSFFSASDVPDLQALIGEALALKADPLAFRSLGRDKTLGLLFMNPSLRTRISTQKAAWQLGMQTLVMNAGQESWAVEFNDGAVMDGTTVEHVKDAAAVLAQYCDILGLRSFAGLTDRMADDGEHAALQFRKYAAKVPFVSLESATLHPLQSLADLITMQEHAPANHPPKVVLTWAPHIKPLPQAVANSFASFALAAGYDLTIAHPPGYELNPAFTQGAAVTNDQRAALEQADFVYVKNWSSWQDYGKILCRDADWMLTPRHLALTRSAKVMHCLPVRRNVELSDAVLDGPHSVVYQQAANRLWAAQVVLKRMLMGLP
jgi:N-succinyl-L-ornithine transcarbamylase